MKEKRKSDPTQISQVISLDRLLRITFDIYQNLHNAVAYRFLTTVTKLEDDAELILRLRKGTTEYRIGPQAALKQIPLLTTPSP